MAHGKEPQHVPTREELPDRSLPGLRVDTLDEHKPEGYRPSRARNACVRVGAADAASCLTVSQSGLFLPLGRATTKQQVRDRPDRLNDATQNPQRLGTSHLRRRTPGQVRQRHAGQDHLNRRTNEDGRPLTLAEVAPPLFGSHDGHATPNGSTRTTGQAACHCRAAAQVRCSEGAPSRHPDGRLARGHRRSSSDRPMSCTQGTPSRAPGCFDDA
jgi:hypothetical protein